jgi:hypothetical protein
MPDRHEFEVGIGIPPRCNRCNQPRSAAVHHTLCTIEVQPAEPWKPVAYSTPAVISLDATDWPAARLIGTPITLADLAHIQDAVWDGRD